MFELNRPKRQKSKNTTTALVVHNTFTGKFVTSHEWEDVQLKDFQTTINCSYTINLKQLKKALLALNQLFIMK